MGIFASNKETTTAHSSRGKSKSDPDPILEPPSSRKNRTGKAYKDNGDTRMNKYSVAEKSSEDVASLDGSSATGSREVVSGTDTIGSVSGISGTHMSAGDSIASLYQDDAFNPEMMITGHIMQWKWAAEEGYPVLRFALILGAAGTIVTSILPFIIDHSGSTPFPTALLAAYSITFAVVILILEFRYLMFRNPFGCRARLRNLITKHLNILKLLWGRGMFAILLGLLTVAQEWDMTLISGAVMVAIGLATVVTGGYASYKLARLRSSLTDTSHLWLEFKSHDSDGDGYIDSTEFSYLLSDIGLDYDDYNLLKTFARIDSDNDERISFREFQSWWKKTKFRAGYGA